MNLRCCLLAFGRVRLGIFTFVMAETRLAAGIDLASSSTDACQLIVGDIHNTDPTVYQAHVPGALAAIARFGRRGIAGGGKIHLLETDPKPERVHAVSAAGWVIGALCCSPARGQRLVHRR
jgi:hypothetical protein